MTFYRFLTLTLVLAAGGYAGGCASTEQVRKEARMSAPSLREGILSLEPRVDAVMNALTHMQVAADPATVAATHAAFAEKVKGLSARVEEIRGEVELMERQGLEYFQLWGREYSKAPSAKAEAKGDADREAYKLLTDYMTAGKTNMRELMATLTVIDKAVAGNPTPAGVAAVRQSCLDATPQAVMVKGSADQIAGQIGKLLTWTPAK